MTFQSRSRNVTAVLGPTNTGKTHLAIERMLGHQSGMIGLPLRLLAREVYDKIVSRIGTHQVALITGEEKIKPDNPRFWVSTVEAMPRDVETDFLAIDEIQLAADPERGHIFTDRLLHARGRSETLLLGAATMREAINDLIPGANFISRPRLSKLAYAGQKKITRLPKRSAIVAFSAAEVYAIAELIRRQLGGAAVVLGALSPRTRNAQVALYQSGDVDYLVATDAVGMGLNLDVYHVAFSAVRKFDGQNHRNLTPGELGQIAGRAGRHMNDGTFGVTADVDPLEADLIERLETHTFDSVRTLQWRNRKLEFSTLSRLHESLRQLPGEPRLQRARMADDVLALETLSADQQIAEIADSRGAVEKLWDVVQIPDYRKISSQNHAELVATIYGYLMSDAGCIPEDWFAKQVALADRTDGDLDTLATRIAHIRTWTFISNRADWLSDPQHWQARTRAIEDSLSDALHEQLTQRFVDRKTSALMRGLRDKAEMQAEISPDGAITVENHYVGRLRGFRFAPDAQSDAQGIHGKAARNTAAHVLSIEFGMRARRVASAKQDAFKITRNGRVLWRGDEIAKLEAGDDPLKPTVSILADEYLSGLDKEKVQARLDALLAEVMGERMKPLLELKSAEDIAGLARGIAFRLMENFGALKREQIADEIRQLDQPARAQLRKYGVRFGAFNIFMPPLLKPVAAELALALWALKNAASAGLSMDSLPEPPRAGLTSVVVDATTPEAFYRVAGYHVCGPRAIRIDMLERLADLIRPLLAWRPSEAGAVPPKGSSGDGGFILVPEMMSILGCSAGELGNVLKSLGFRLDRRPLAVAGPPPSIEGAPDVPVAETSAPQSDALPVPSSGGEDGALDETPPAPAASDDTAAAAETPVSIESGPAPAQVQDEIAAHAPMGASPIEMPATPPEPEPADDAQPPVEATSSALPVEGSAEPAAAVPIAALEPVQASASESSPTEPEIQYIDIWRPKRRERSERARHGRARDEARNPREGEARRSGRDQRRPQATPAETPGAPSDHAAGPASPEGAEAAAPPVRELRAPRQDHDARKGGDRPRDDKRDSGPRDTRPREERAREGGARHDKPREDRRRPDDRPRFQQQQRSASPNRKGGIDPDSPFAALSALRTQLEKQAKERGSA